MNSGHLGLYASKDIKKGDLIVVERAVGHASGSDQYKRLDQLVE